MTIVTCTVNPAVIQRLHPLVLELRGFDDAWADALEAAIHAVEHGSDLTASHREVIEVAIARDIADGPIGFMAEDLTELLALVEKRRQGHDIAPPPCTEEQLLAVRCPACTAAVGAYCQQRGKALLLPQQHAERFWATAPNGGALPAPPTSSPRERFWTVACDIPSAGHGELNETQMADVVRRMQESVHGKLNEMQVADIVRRMQARVRFDDQAVGTGGSGDDRGRS